MKKVISLILSLLLSLSLVACQSVDENEAFRTWMDESVFKILEPSDTGFNQLYLDPSAKGIDKVRVTWPEYSLEANAKANEVTLELYAELSEFGREKLDDDLKASYDVLNWALTPINEEYQEAFYLISNNVLGSYTGILSSVFITFYYFNINDRQDVDNYIYLLDTLDDFAYDLIAFEELRQEKGYGMPPEEVAMTLNNVNSVLRSGDYDFLVDSFKEKIEDTDLERSTKDAYITQVEGDTKENIDGFYTIIRDGLNELEIRQSEGATLFDVPYGREYYEQMVFEYTGYEDMDAYVAYVESLIDEYAQKIASYTDIPTGPIYDSDDPNAVIDHIKTAMTNDFPQIEDVDYKMIIAPEPLADLLGATSAFYVLAALDDPLGDQKLTLVGDYSDSDFLTIAHEGYPGHMYQNIYDATINKTPDIVRILNIAGYTEGYANYVEEYSAKYADEPILASYNKDLETYLTLNCVLSDYKMHYLGEDGKEDLVDMIGVGDDSELISPLLRQLQLSPGIFIKYYICGAQIKDLHDEVDEVAGKTISDMEFHTAILSHGPMPIDLLYEYVLADFSY